MPSVDLGAVLRPTEGRLRVDGPTLQSERITALLTDFFPDVPVDLQGATSQPGTFKGNAGDVDAIEVTGTLVPDFLGATGLTVDAWFFLVDGIADVVMTIVGTPGPWSLLHSFPLTVGSAAANAAFDDCIFTLDSRQRDGLGADFNAVLQYDPTQSTPSVPADPMLTSPSIKKGLSLTAQLELSSFDDTLTGLVPAGRIPVTGRVEIVAGRPRMRLSTSGHVASFSFQDMQLLVDYQFLTAPMQRADSTVYQKTRERLTTTLVYEGQQETLTVPLAATFDPGSLTESVLIATDSDHSSALSLQTLKGLIPGDFGQLIPSTVPGLDQLALTDLSFAVAVSPLAFQAVHARVALPGSWPIVPDLVTFANLRIDLTVTHYGDEWQLHPYIMGTLTVAGGQLTGIFDLAARTFFCMLDDDSVVDLRALLGQKLHLAGILPERAQFDVTQFEIQGDMSASTYSLEVGTTLNWPMQVGATTVTLENLFISLEYADGGSPTGTLSGTLAIGGVTAGIVAKYDSAGLSFAVTAYNLKLSELIANILGNATLTAHLPTVEFALLDLAVTPGTGRFSLKANGRIAWQLPFGAAGMAMGDLAVTLTRTAGTGGNSSITGSLQGKLTLAADQNYDLLVSADLAAGEGLRFKGSTGPGQEIPIGKLAADLASRFGDVALPAPLAGLVVENLRVAFDTKTKDFSFSAEAKFPVGEGQQVDIVVTIDMKNAAGVYTSTFGGQITVGSLIFNLRFSRSTAVTFCVATYSHAGTVQSINIKELVGHLSSEVAALVPTDLEIDLKDVVLALSRSTAGTSGLIGLDVGAHLTLSGLPLVGQEFPADASAGIDDLRLLVATGDLRRAEVTAINELLPSNIAKLPIQAGAPADPAPGDAVTLTRGLTVSAKLNLGGTPQTLSMPVTSSGSGSGAGKNVPATTATPVGVTSSDSAKWFTLQKTLGPLYLARIGVQYKDSVLWFLLDAAISAMGLTLSLDGLGLGSPITRFDPRFSLRGLGLDYRNPAVEIGAAFLRTTVTDKQGRTYDEYDGAAVLKAKALTLSAIGSYAYLDGHPSLFIYAVLDYPIGGPAFFFVTGLSAGFGYNRALVVPPIDQVAQFPLVSEAMKGSAPPPAAPKTGEVAVPDNPAQRVMAELELLRSYIPPSIGDSFLAVGIKFTSFKMIDSFALLTIAFGHRFELNVLGLSTLLAPPPIPGEPAVTPLVEIQMALKASFIPDQGFLGVAAQLTSASYVISPDCHLTGGFAFYCWFPVPGYPVPNAGDFALTLGGYHPDFDIPGHYPRVPRLGVNWKVNDELSIKGEAYFALTPAALMAGVLVDATWNSGDLRAWFHAGADFIVAWKPYHYDAHVFATLRVSYRFEFFGTQEIRVDASADLHLWGPPFSGTASIKLSVVEFDIAFGAGAQPAPTPIDWRQFKLSFLPQGDPQGGAIPCCSISLGDGLVRKVAGNPADDLGIVNPKRFVVVTDSIIPSTSAVTGQAVDVTALQLSPVGVAPMAVAAGDLRASQTIRILLNGGPAEQHFQFAPIFKKAPAALWGGSLLPTLNGARFVDRVLSGFEVRPKDDVEPVTGASVARAGWQYTDAPVRPAYSWEGRPGADVGGELAGAAQIRDTIAQAATVTARTRLMAALRVDAPIDVDASVADAFTVG